MLTRPNELQQAIAELNEQAEIALDQKMGVGPTTQATPSDRTRVSRPGNGRSTTPNRNGQPNGRGATQAQRKAIAAIATQLGIDPGSEIRHELGVELDNATVNDASRFIDHLKSLQATATNRSRS
ncbi:MAG: hypothetical protein AAGI37_03900 [Planctomycetota bacterium]